MIGAGFITMLNAMWSAAMTAIAAIALLFS